MNEYTVTVTYTIGTSAVSTSIIIRRLAKTASMAISAVSAIFGSLSNYYDTNGTPWIRISQITAAIVQPESNT